MYFKTKEYKEIIIDYIVNLILYRILLRYIVEKSQNEFEIFILYTLIISKKFYLYS